MAMRLWNLLRAGSVTPLRAAGPGLVLPNRHGRLDRVDPEPRRLKGLWPRRRRCSSNHRDLGEFEASGAMDRDDPSKSGPPPASLVDDRLETRHDLFLVRLVLQELNAVAPRRVVADRASETHERAAGGRNRPRARLCKRQRVATQRDPVVTVWKIDHPLILPARAGSAGLAGGSCRSIISSGGAREYDETALLAGQRARLD